MFAPLFPLGFGALVAPAEPCLLLGTDLLATLLGADPGPSPGPGLPPRPSVGAQGCAMHTTRLWGHVAVPRAHPCPPRSPPGHRRARPKGEGAREAPAPPASLRAPQAKHTLKHNVKVLFFSAWRGRVLSTDSASFQRFGGLQEWQLKGPGYFLDITGLVNPN